MRGPPDVPNSHIPGTVVKLPHLAHIYPAPVFTYFDLIVWTNLDPPATLLKGADFSGGDHPFANPFALIRPHGDANLILPVIDDFKDTTGFIPVVFRWRGLWLLAKLRPTGRQRDLYLYLRTGKQGCA